MISRVEAWSVPVLALLGLGVSAYLSILHWRGEIPPCGGYAGCAQVNNSVYAEIYGIPVAAFGVLLYLALLTLGLGRLRLGSRWQEATFSLYGLVVAGVVFMGYLTYIEVFVLRALCYWCLGLALITLFLFFLLIQEVWALRTRTPQY